VPALLGRLAERYRPQLIVIACNTASTIALGHVRAALDVPIVGTVPAIKPAAALSHTRTIGVLGTEATVRQAYVDDLTARFAGDCRVIRHGSAALVEMAEARLAGEAGDPGRFRAVLAGLADQPGGAEIDVVVNACNHFPLVEAELAEGARALWSHPVAFVDGGEGIARRIVALMQGRQWHHRDGEGIAVFTRLSDRERALAPALAARGFSRMEGL
jgi:glutamate racemase